MSYPTAHTFGAVGSGPERSVPGTTPIAPALAQTYTGGPNVASVAHRIAARPTTYNGIEMRSRLEAWWAARMDEGALVWHYEPCAFAGPGVDQYLPDFRWDIPRPGGRTKHVFLELKGFIASLAELDGFLGRMEVIWNSEPEATLLLVQGHAEHVWHGHIDEAGERHWAEIDARPEAIMQLGSA